MLTDCEVGRSLLQTSPESGFFIIHTFVSVKVGLENWLLGRKIPEKLCILLLPTIFQLRMLLRRLMATIREEKNKIPARIEIELRYNH